MVAYYVVKSMADVLEVTYSLCSVYLLVFVVSARPVQLQPRPRNVLLLQDPMLKMSNRCFWTGAEPKQSLMR